MTEFIQSATTWGLHAAVAGAVVFALGWACVRRLSTPARRHALAAWVVRGGLVAAVLCVFPAWLLLPAPKWGASPPATPEPIPDRPLPPEEARPLPSPTAFALPPEPERWVVVALAAIPVEEPREPLPLANPERERRGDAPTAVAEVPPPLKAPHPVAHAPGSPEVPSLSVAPLILVAYGVGVTVAAVPLILGVVALVRLRRSGGPAPAAVQAVFNELAAGCRARLLVSNRVSSPLCFGLFRPVVVIPKALATTATDAELRWVFAHELDHLRRGDPWSGWWVAVARAVYFFLPWFWRVRRELVLAQEQLADAAAVAAGGRGEDYAAFLVRLSGDPAGRRHPVGAAGVRAGKSDLFWRVTMLLTSKDTTPVRASRRWTVAAAAGVLGTAVVLSGVGFASPVQDEKKSAEKKVEKTEKPKPAKEDKPKAAKEDVQVGPPPQLATLRKAVEAAAKKGENVDDIRKQLEELEKALAGKAWKKPAFVPDAPPPPPAPGFQPFQPPGAFVPPAARVMPPNFGQGFAFPPGEFNFNFGGAMDQEALKKAQEVLEKAMEALKKNPNDPEVFDKAMKEYQKLLGEAFKGGNLLANPNVFGGGIFVGPDGVVQRFGDRGARTGGDGRLGVQVEKVPAVLVEQLGLEAGKGLVVSDVRKDTAADKAGLKKNDIILEFAGKPVTDNAAEFIRAVAGVKKGDKVDVTVLRKGKKEAVKGIELPDAAPARGRLENNPANDPNVDLPPRGGFRAVPRPLPPAAGVDGASASTSITVNNNEFTIESAQDGVKFTITGSLEGGKAVPSKIKVVDGETKVDAESVEKVPAAYRDRVTKLLGSIRGR